MKTSTREPPHQPTSAKNGAYPMRPQCHLECINAASRVTLASHTVRSSLRIRTRLNSESILGAQPMAMYNASNEKRPAT
eukprot:1816926-Amphidinium_carterae.2